MAATDLRPEGEPSSLVGAVKVLRERWWLVLLAFVACILGSLFLSKAATVQYEATAQLLIGQQTSLGSLIDPNAPQQGSSDPARDQNTALLLVTSPTIADRVKRVTGDPAPASSLSAGVVASAEADANLISVTATDPVPARAQRLADAFAQQYADYRTQSARTGVTEGALELRKERDQLAPEDVAQRATIDNALRRIVAIRAVTQGDAQVVARAGLPTSQSSPRTKRDLMLAAILGLVLGVALAFLLDLFDRRLKTVEDFERAFGLRALATVPQHREQSDGRDRASALEPFRILNNGLGLLPTPRRIRVLLVTSAIPGEGKSTVAAGLARAAAQSGQRVVLVEADLRRPTFHQKFTLTGSRRGLSTALIDGEPMGRLARPLANLNELAVIAAGPTTLDSADLLGGPGLQRIIEELLDDADLVILDAPPLLPVADAQVLLDHPIVDAAILVGRAYRTGRDDARRARSMLEQHSEATFGLVVNGLHEADGVYAYYLPAEPVKQGRLARLRA